VSAELPAGERRRLLSLAREAVARYLAGEGPPPMPEGEPRRAVFVTWRWARSGELRGCIGHLHPVHSLSEAVAVNAVAAAIRDPRFEPVTPEELSDLSVEISVLSAFEEIAPESVEAGRHGLVIEARGRRGLLLPQVAREQGWTARELLEHTCLKAGLDVEDWRSGDAKLQAFTAEVFGEQESGKPVI